MNGKPRKPLTRTTVPGGRFGGLAPAPTSVLWILLEVDPSVLGARSGDRVRLQLLHCEPWHGMGFHPVVIEPRMTNRVEFTVP